MANNEVFHTVYSLRKVSRRQNDCRLSSIFAGRERERVLETAGRHRNYAVVRELSEGRLSPLRLEEHAYELSQRIFKFIRI